MNNATKFTEQGYVALCVSVKDRQNDDAELAISVKDSGQGIREEDLPEQLVELMRGSIGVKSEYGKGSEFYFTIHQKITGTEKAAKISVTEKPIIVAGRMKNLAAQEQLQKLAAEYGMSFIEDILSAVSENGQLKAETARQRNCFLCLRNVTSSLRKAKSTINSMLPISVRSSTISKLLKAMKLATIPLEPKSSRADMY